MSALKLRRTHLQTKLNARKNAAPSSNRRLSRSPHLSSLAPIPPKVDFRQPVLMQEVLGNYTLQTTFYDANYNPVTHANVAGRYGAIVQVVPQTREPFQRAFTLYRQNAPVDWNAVKTQFAAELPPEIGVEAEVLVERRAPWSEFLQGVLVENLSSNSKAAVVLAGLHEAQFGDGSGSWNNPYHRDETWWYGLKKKLGQIEPTRYIQKWSLRLQFTNFPIVKRNQHWYSPYQCRGYTYSGRHVLFQSVARRAIGRARQCRPE